MAIASKFLMFVGLQSSERDACRVVKPRVRKELDCQHDINSYVLQQESSVCDNMHLRPL